MNVAVGRLNLSISMESPAKLTPATPAPTPRVEPKLEDAFIHDRTYREVESDRSRWADSYRQLRGPVF